MSDSPRSRLSRETRLLLIVITLSAVVLFALSRFRFPEPSRGETAASPALLERMAARATYDELAAIIADLSQRVAPFVSVLRVETGGQQRFVPAVRVRPDLALAHVPGDSRVLAVVGTTGSTPEVVGYDAERELVLIRVDADPARVVPLSSAPPASSAPRYVVAVEGTRGGPTLRPVFLGRTDPLQDERYGDLLVLGGLLQASPGSLIFELDGSFVGLCILEEGFIAGVPGRALDAAVQRMLAPAGG